MKKSDKSIFIFKHFSYGNTEVEMKTEQVALDEILRNFEEFLRGCGFHFTGHIDIVEDDVDCKMREDGN